MDPWEKRRGTGQVFPIKQKNPWPCDILAIVKEDTERGWTIDKTKEIPILWTGGACVDNGQQNACGGSLSKCSWGVHH